MDFEARAAPHAHEDEGMPPSYCCPQTHCIETEGFRVGMAFEASFCPTGWHALVFVGMAFEASAPPHGHEAVAMPPDHPTPEASFLPGRLALASFW
jgi:hypothetical protein